MTHDVFISYSSKDKATAEAVCAALEQQGIRCWITPRDILPGVKYAEAIVDAISACQVFLLILSASANESPQVGMEIDRAASKDIPILTFRIGDFTLSKSLEYYLSSRHWLDASSGPIQDQLPILIQTLRRLLAREEGSPIPVNPVQPQSAPAVSKPASPAASPTGPINPFTFGNPIREPERFYGHTSEIRQIVSRLLSSAHESTSIVGERRIGKTSLLNYLSHPQVAAGLGLTPDKYCLVYADFQGLTDITPQRFWQRILEKMARSICDESLKPDLQKLARQTDLDLFDLEDIFESAQSRGLTVVLMMDEFEYVTQNANFKSDFFGGLRALAIHHGVALLPATRRELVELCHSEEIKGSPFFNIFANVILYPLQRSEVDLLFDGYSKGCDFSIESAERDFLWGLGGGYPFFIQMAGFYLIEGKTQSLSGDALNRFVTEQFQQQADSHFSYLWSHCSESEKITLLALLALGQKKSTAKTLPNRENITRIRPRSLHDLDELGKRGLTAERDGLYSLFSTALAGWIRNEIVARPGEEENPQNVEAWLASGGRDSISDSKGWLPKFKKKYWPILCEVSKEFSLQFAAAGVLELVRLFV